MIDVGAIISSFRKTKHWTQNELAKRAGMPSTQLCLIEKGRVSPTVRTLERIAYALESDVVTLLGGNNGVESRPANALPVQTLPGDYVSLRANEPDAAKALKAILADEEERNEFESLHGISSACHLSLNHAQTRLEGSGAAVASEVRTALGIGTAPFGNLVELLELNGARLYKVKLPQRTSSVALWNKKRNSLSIVLNKVNTPERDMYSIASEIARACLFVSANFAPLQDTHTEHRFQRDFAAAFLMPDITVRQMVAHTGIAQNDWTLQAICRLKIKFGVSAEAFALRLETLGLIAPGLRLELRELLRERYITHPSDMEPAPNLPPLNIQHCSRKILQ